MPLYTYEIVNDDGTAGETFEVMRKMSDPPLERHPETGQRVRRVFTPIHVAGASSGLHDKSRLNDKNLERLGFTAYRKNGKGHYERTAGKEGPSQISTGD
jgi:predicted nucleic acid-binding Zn ribbon protein